MKITEQKVRKREWSLSENTMIKNRLPFDIRVSIQINENRELEISIIPDEELKGKLEEG